METNIQENLFETQQPWVGMPSTRYQGSKKKLLPTLHKIFENLNFVTCLDAFGGTGSVSFLLKQMHKSVTFNDIMPCNSVMAESLFSQGPSTLSDSELRELFVKQGSINYKTVIKDTYGDIYFTDEENEQIDIFCQNANILARSKRNEAYYVLFQSLLSKRPYNLFHRANLHMRTKEVERSFGNKATWDKPIVDHCLKFLKELRTCKAYQSFSPVQFKSESAFEISTNYDLVYIDTPYAKSKGTQESNYFNFYHFLDALLAYDEINKNVKSDVKHKPFYEVNKSWYPAPNIDQAFQELFERFSKSILVISYRSDGFPSVSRMEEILRNTHKSVKVLDIGEYKYVLSTQLKETKEIVIIAEPSTSN